MNLLITSGFYRPRKPAAAAEPQRSREENELLNTEKDMVLFDNLYEIRDGKVYWNRNAIPKADTNTFMWLGGNWARDAKSIYVHDSQRKGIDPATFVYLNPVFVKDANGVYDWEGKIKDADPTTFSVLDPGVYVAERYSTKVWARGYGKDRNSVYYHDQMVGRASVVRGADPDSFISLRNDYGYDSDSVWLQKSMLRGADPKTWIYLSRKWSMDCERIFYAEREVTGVDRSHFTVAGLPTIGNYATDWERYYNADSEIGESEFWKMIEHCASKIPVWLQVFRDRILNEGRRL